MVSCGFQKDFRRSSKRIKGKFLRVSREAFRGGSRASRGFQGSVKGRFWEYFRRIQGV